MKILLFIKKKAIVFSAMLMIALVFTNAGLIIYNSYVLDRATKLRSEAEQAQSLIRNLWTEVAPQLDLGLRGFALTKDEALLQPYKLSQDNHKLYFRELEGLLQRQSYPNEQYIAELKAAYDTYLKQCALMLDLARKDDLVMFTNELKKDKGLALWLTYQKISADIKLFESQLAASAMTDYDAATTRTVYLQIVLVILGLPTLLFMIFRIRDDEKERKNLFLELEKNNRQYLFDPGTPLEVTDEKELINSSINNFKKAASFINQVSSGNFDVEWEHLTEGNKVANQTNLAGELVQMREKMKVLKVEDAKRLWATEGLAKFSDIIRSQQHDLQALCENVVRFAVKYVGAQQGGLFLLREDDSGHQYLELTGCYAFDRKKFVDKKLEIGQGLVGQTYLEQQTAMLTKIPHGYTFITSGLGDTTPSCLMVVPMKYNEKVEAVLEIAGFGKFEPYQIELMEKIGEITASTLVSVKTTEKTQRLLEQFREQTEQLRSQEEELRQNMEEMEATQEEMRRKEQELEHRHYEMQEMLQQK